MRMRELAAESGFPRTAIHHYLREGLLPPPVKTARNAAVYDEGHLERLALIRSLRGGELGTHPLETVRSVVALVECGMSPAVAVAIQALPGAGGDAPPGPFSEADVFRAADLASEVGEALVSAGLLAPSGSPRGSYGTQDVAMARTYASLLEGTGLAVADLAPVADLLREVSGYERTLGELVEARGGERGLEARRLLARALTAMHHYLFVRGAGAD